MHTDICTDLQVVGSSPPGDVSKSPSRSIALLAADAERALRALAFATEDLRTLRDEDTFESMRAVAAGQRFLESARLSLVGELDSRSLPKRTAGLGTRQWLGHHHGWSSPTASRQIHVARKCRSELPLLADALRDGRLSFEHVMFVAYRLTDRTREFVIEMQPVFIDLVEGRRFETWAHLVDELIQMADTDGGFAPDADDNRLVMSDLFDGQLSIRLGLVGAEALETQTILLAELERRHRAHRRLRSADPEHRIPSRSRLLAEAHLELLRRGHSAGSATKVPVTDVTLVIHASDPVHSHTLDGVLVQDGTTRLLNCDSVTHAVVVDSLGVPLDKGRARRFFDPDQIRAIQVRDGGCTHPGCDAPVTWTQIHHIDEFRPRRRTDRPRQRRRTLPHPPRTPAPRMDRPGRRRRRRSRIHLHLTHRPRTPLPTSRPTTPLNGRRSSCRQGDASLCSSPVARATCSRSSRPGPRTGPTTAH